MGPQLRSALLAGFIASSVWMFITVAVDSSKNFVLIGGAVFLVGVALVTAVVATLVGRGRSGPAGR